MAIVTMTEMTTGTMDTTGIDKNRVSLNPEILSFHRPQGDRLLFIQPFQQFILDERAGCVLDAGIIME